MKQVKSVKDKKLKIAVIGGGIFGTTCALILGKYFAVSVFERHEDILAEASYANQYRHHMGYHYPRSGETIEEIKNATKDFEAFFKPIIVAKFPSYYAVAKTDSKVSAREFLQVCREKGLPYVRAYPPAELLNRKEVSVCVKTPEKNYDYQALKKFIRRKLKDNPHISLNLNQRITGAALARDGKKVLTIQKGKKKVKREFDYVINATYANYNNFCNWMKFTPRKIHYRLKEVIIVKIKHPQTTAVTVMDGPFATFIPIGHDNLYTFGDVPLSVHEEYAFSDSALKIEKKLKKLKTRWLEMQKRSSKWLPIIKSAQYVGSMFVILPVEPASDPNNARPTVITNHGHGCWSVLSGKIITCVSAARTILKEIQSIN